MKRAGFAIAAAAAVLLVSDAALGATRYVRSPRSSDEQPTVGNVHYGSGNVRYSVPRATLSPRTVTRTAPLGPIERTPTASHVIRTRNTHLTAGATTRMATQPDRRISLGDDHIRPTIHYRTPPRRTDVSADWSPPATGTGFNPPRAIRPYRRDSADEHSDSSVGNVHHGPDYGNVTYSDQHRDWSRYRRVADYFRHHGHGSSWASGLTFIYHGGGTYFSVGSGDDAPYWYNGGWHPWPRGRARGPGSGCVLYYGFWIDVRDVYYVQQLPPPWTTEQFWATSAEGWDEAALDNEPVTEEPPSQAESDFIPKSQVLDLVRDQVLVLSTAERSRVEALIAGGVIQQLLNQDGGTAYDYVYDPRGSRLQLTAPAERIAMIETIVRDRPTFEAVTEPDRYGNTAAVLPLVSPIYLEQDPSAARALALDNFYAVRSLLEGRDALYVQNGKRCWYNSQYGTATVVDQENGLDQAFGFMETRPFVPRDLVQR
jgi:hypothetical protein